MITLEQLKAIMPLCKNAKGFLPELNKCLVEFEINTPARMAAFLAQLAHESVSLNIWEENLNYSAKGLLVTWPRRFTRELADKYARKPQAIANFVYASRLGNGNEASGDGWKYHGRGPIQLTFHDNYKEAGNALGLDLVSNPERAAQLDVGFRTAGWFWKSRHLNSMADASKYREITLKVNGGLTHYEDRLRNWNKAKQVLAVP